MIRRTRAEAGQDTRRRSALTLEAYAKYRHVSVRRTLPGASAFLVLLMLALPEDVAKRPARRIGRRWRDRCAVHVAAAAVRLQSDRAAAADAILALRQLSPHQWDAWLTAHPELRTGALADEILHVAVSLPIVDAFTACRVADTIASVLGDDLLVEHCRIEVQRFHASLLRRLGRRADALNQLDSAVRAAHASPRAWLMLPELRLERAEILLDLGDHKRAVDDATDAYRFFKTAGDDERTRRAARVMNQARSYVNLTALLQ